MFDNVTRKELAKALGGVLLRGNPEKSSTLMQAYVTFDAIQKKAVSDFGHAYDLIKPELLEYSMALLKALDFSDSNAVKYVSDLFLNFDFIDFLRWACPDVICDISTLRDFFHRNFQENVALTVQHIICVKLVPIEMKKSLDERMTVIESDSYDEAIDKIYEIYCRIEMNNAIRLDRNLFRKFYSAINQYVLEFEEQFPVRKDSKFSMNAKLLRAVNDMWDMGLSRLQQEEFIYCYFVNGETVEGLISRFKISNKTRIKEPEDRIKKAREVCRSLASYTPLECLCATKVFRQMEGIASDVSSENVFVPNDVSLENGLIYSLFTSSVSSCKIDKTGVAVLFPSPYFVRKWTKDHALDGIAVTFVMRNDYEAAILNHAFLVERNKPSIMNLDGWTFALKNKAIHFSQCLLFASNMSVKEQDVIYKDIKEYCDDSIEIYSLVSSHEFETALSPLASELSGPRMEIPSIAIIPQGINNSSRPRRKVFIKCNIRGKKEDCNFSRKTRIFTYTINTDLKTQGLSKLAEEPVECETDTVSLYASIRKLYRDEMLRRRAAGRTKVTAVSYEFTRDISIWFAKSYPKENKGRPRIEAYVCEATPFYKILRGYIDRGAAITETAKRVTRLPEDNIFGWLEYEYPFSCLRPRNTRKELDEIFASGAREYSLKPIVNIRDEIVAAYAPRLEGEDIALKTFWYIRPDIEDLLSDEDYCRLEKIVRSDLGYCRLSELTAEQCEDMLIQCFANETAEELTKRFKVLAFVVDLAIQFGYTERNFLKEVIEKKYKKNKLFAQVRAALVKKHFTFDEMVEAFHEIKERINEGQTEYIGVLIRLLTGLESNIVCALKYKDYIEAIDYGIKQLLITCQLTNDGALFKAFAKLEDYRKFPCISILQEELDQQCEVVKSLIDEETTDMLDLPIVTTMERLKRKNQRWKHYAPKELDELCRDVFISVGIPDRIIEVPDSKGGTKETNLSRYGGDFFKENFRHWARALCKMQQDEILYLLGNKPATTFGRYYCDFLNDAVQLQLLVKMQRWEPMFTCTDSPKAKLWKTGMSNAYEKEFGIDGIDPLQLNIDVTLSNQRGTLKMEASSKFGVSVYAFPAELERGRE